MTVLVRALRLLGGDDNNNSGNVVPRSLMPRETDSGLLMEQSVDRHRPGVLAMGTIGLISFVSALALLSFLTYRFIFWRKYYKRPLAENQYVVLIYNLLLADLQQSTAFMIAYHYAAQNKVTFGTAACYLQGWWIQTADPGSGLFVLAIAMHTASVVLRGRQPEYRTVVYCMIGLWVFILVLGIIPVAMYGSETFVISESGWCWLSQDYQDLRIWAHYLWIFVAEFGNFLLYGIMFFYLRRRTKQAHAIRQNNEQLNRLNRVVFYMVIYPFAYLVLSLPLAVGRMLTATNHTQSETYFAVAGSLMALSGFVNVLLYTLTRRRLVLENDLTHSDRTPDYSQSNTYQTRISAGGDRTDDRNGVTKGDRRGGWKMGRGICSRFRNMEGRLGTPTNHGEGSTEDIVPKEENMEMNALGHEGVYQQTTIEVSHEPSSNTSNDQLREDARIHEFYE